MQVLQSFLAFALCTFANDVKSLGIDNTKMYDVYLRSQDIQTSLEKTIDMAKSMIQSVEKMLSEAHNCVEMIEDKLKACGQNNMWTELLENKLTPSSGNHIAHNVSTSVAQNTAITKATSDNDVRVDKLNNQEDNETDQVSHPHEIDVASGIFRGFRTTADDRVAFRVSGISREDGYHSGDRIVFASVDHNEGSGYDLNSGIFTCPTTGTYFFTATIGSVNRVYIDAVLKIDGVVKMSLYAGYRLQGDNMSTAVTIAHCSVGQSVWMEVRNGDHLGGWESMSGFLLWSGIARF
ncbi:hypothetical protein ACJMK2_022479 [Sinanodonta woodiana]|uniref:C1q domain-containing protein n=1 Tax=Sinanodonta woodiana TaxID=1069815 RepID=A0ABD3TKY8_SINWO